MSRQAWRRALGGLKTRILVWLLAAITLAIGASALAMMLTRTTESESPPRLVSRHVQARAARVWDDPAATEAFVAELRDTTGLDIRVRREPGLFPGGRRRAGNIVFEDGATIIPIVKRGQSVGAIELRTGADPPRPWRVVVALGAALVVLGLVARRVSAQLARPLELVAGTAERFGGGELTARTGVEKLSRRWVAEEVREVARAFDAMAERISRVVLDQRELLGAISHELRSPLGRAKVAIEIARERAGGEGAADPSAGGIARALDDVDRQLVEIDTILGDLLASARAGLADLRRERVDIVAWLEERAGAETAGSVVVRDAPRSSITMELDRALLGRALHNVFANAWSHGHPKDVPIEVSITATKDAVRIVVRDRGPGFAPDVLARAFDPFVTGTGPARSPGAHGIGLGLTLVRRIVEAHGGRTSAENVEESGSPAGAVVVVELPRPVASERGGDERLGDRSFGPESCPR